MGEEKFYKCERIPTIPSPTYYNQLYLYDRKET